MQKNRIELAGYLAAKPEVRFLASGTKVANARMGETQRYTDKDGKPQQHTNWHSLVFYNDLADIASNYEQGDNVFVEGSLQQRKFTPADGVARTVHEVQVRTCHVIAPSRREEVQPTEEEGAGRDASWPV